MLLPTHIFWQLPLASGLIGYGAGYFLPRLVIAKYYARLENSIVKGVASQLASATPKQLLGDFIQTVSPESVELWLAKRVGQVQKSLQTPATIRKLYRLGDDYIPLVFQQIGKRYLQSLDQAKRDKMTQWMGELYEQVFSQINLQYNQSEVLMDVIFGIFLTPAAIRQMLMESVAHMPSDALEKIIKQQLSGIAGMVIKFIDLKPVIERFKSTVTEEPQQVTQTVLQLLDQFEIREKLAERLSRFRWADLPERDRENIKHWINRFLDEWLQDDPDTLCQLLVKIGSGSSRLLMRGILQTDWLKLLTSIPEDAETASDRTILKTVSGYLCDALVQSSKTPPQWILKAASNAPSLAEKALARYPLEKRRAFALQVAQPLLQPAALASAGIGVGYGVLSILVLWLVA